MVNHSLVINNKLIANHSLSANNSARVNMSLNTNHSWSANHNLSINHSLSVKNSSSVNQSLKNSHIHNSQSLPVQIFNQSVSKKKIFNKIENYVNNIIFHNNYKVIHKQQKTNHYELKQFRS